MRIFPHPCSPINDFVCKSMTRSITILFILSLTVLCAVSRANDFIGFKNRPADVKPTRITSDQLDYDYQNFVAVFTGHVVIVDPEFRMRSDKMIVWFRNTNELAKVEAAGHVDLRMDMTNGQMVATCGKAVYTAENSQVLLEQLPNSTDPSGLPTVKKGENMIQGKRLSVWLLERRVTVEADVVLDVKPNEVEGSMKKTKD